MKFVDVKKEREAREEREKKMLRVLENDLVRIELKNGQKIESANVSIKPYGGKNNIGAGYGDIEGIMRRTVENILNAVSALVQCGIAGDEKIDGMIDAIANEAKGMARCSVLKLKDTEGDACVLELEVGGDK